MVKEITIVNTIEEYFKKQKFYVIREAPVLERRIDILAINEKEIIAVEAKVRKWEKIFRQVLFCKLFADKVYAAFPEVMLEKISLSPFRKYGIGIISVNDCIKIIIESRKSRKIQKDLKNYILQKFGGKNETLL